LTSIGRFRHACGKIEYKGTHYLVVAGGYISYADPFMTSIEVLNTNTMDQWTPLESLSLPTGCEPKPSGLITNVGENNGIFFTCYENNYLFQDGTWHHQPYGPQGFDYERALRMPNFYFGQCHDLWAQ